jgi:transcription antitermination factor NusG
MCDGLEIGQKVRILSGPFAETIYRLAHLDDRGRAHLLLEIMAWKPRLNLAVPQSPRQLKELNHTRRSRHPGL